MLLLLCFLAVYLLKLSKIGLLFHFYEELLNYEANLANNKTSWSHLILPTSPRRVSRKTLWFQVRHPQENNHLLRSVQHPLSPINTRWTSLKKIITMSCSRSLISLRLASSELSMYLTVLMVSSKIDFSTSQLIKMGRS